MSAPKIQPAAVADTQVASPTVAVPASAGPAPAAAPQLNSDEPTMAEAPIDSADGPTWPDESAEAAFLADARERGEPVKATPAAVEAAEEVDPKAMPNLDDLVARIPADVRDTLEELFRAKFVRVQRVPKRVLKG